MKRFEKFLSHLPGGARRGTIRDVAVDTPSVDPFDAMFLNFDPTPRDVRTVKAHLADQIRPSDLGNSQADAHPRVMKALLGEGRVSEVLRSIDGRLDVDGMGGEPSRVAMLLIWICATEREPYHVLLLHLLVAAHRPEEYKRLRAVGPSHVFSPLIGARFRDVPLRGRPQRELARALVRGHTDPDLDDTNNAIASRLLQACESLPSEDWSAPLRLYLPREDLPRVPSEHRRDADSPALVPVVERQVGEGRVRVCSSRLGGHEALYDGIRLVPLPNVDTWRRSLEDEFPWMRDAIGRLASQLALRGLGRGRAAFRLPPVAIHGAAGIGKSRFVRRMAFHAGVPVHRFNASGHSGAVSLLGASRTYRNSTASLPVKAMLATDCANPVLFVDEFDKFGSSDWNGDPSEALLSMLEDETARTFPDDFLTVEVDVSRMSFVLTANDLSRLSQLLLDRILVIEVPNPGPEHFEHLLSGVLGEVAGEVGLEPAEMPNLPSEMIDACRAAFLSSGSIRGLQKAVRSCVGEIARDLLRP